MKVQFLILAILLAFCQTYDVTWLNTEGSLKYISVDIDGTIIGVNSNDDIYMKSVGANFIKIAGKLKQVAIRNGFIIGCNSADNIYYRPPNSQTWTQLDGQLKHVSIDSNGNIIGVNNLNDIYYRTSVSSTSSWTKLDGSLNQVDIANGIIVGVNKNQDIYYKSNVNSQWVQITGKLKHISISNSAVLCGVNVNNQIYIKQSTTQGTWDLIPGALKQLDLKTSLIWGVNIYDQIFNGQLNNLQSKQVSWTNIAGTLEQVSIDLDGKAVGVNAAQQIFIKIANGNWIQSQGSLIQVDIRNNFIIGCNSAYDIYYQNFPQPQWFKLDGKLKQVAVDSDGAIIGVNSANEIYYKASLNAAWEKIDGSLIQVDIADGMIIGVNVNHDIYFKNSIYEPWVFLSGGKLKYVSIDMNGNIMGASDTDQIYFKQGAFKGPWYQLNGFLKQMDLKSSQVMGVNSNDSIYKTSL